jgi:hypothetical protein
MGSKKELGQVKRSWEREVARPVSAINLVRTWMAAADRSGASRNEPPAMAGMISLFNWETNHRTIYSIDTDMCNELTRSGLPDESIPPDILRRLPHESPMFVLDEPVLINHETYECLYGQFIVLPMYLKEDRASLANLETCNILRFVWFGHNVENLNDYSVLTQTVYLDKGKLDLNKELKEVMADPDFPEDIDERLPEFVLARRDSNWAGTTKALFPIATMLVLYACSDEPDFVDIEPPSILRKRGAFKGDDLTIKHLGIRIGAALRSHRSVSSSSDGSPQSVMTPHVRRAHWHRFWTGPLNGERRLVLRWLPPIPVNIDKGDIPATIRPMRKTA